MYSFRQRKAVEQLLKKRWLKLEPTLNENSGIYILTRTDENGIKYAYVGQAKHILSRLAQHLLGYQHIDLSLKKHGLWAQNNIYGWDIKPPIFCHEEILDDTERANILKYASLGYQLHNKTAGGQGKGKVGIAENKPAKGYYDGKKQGYKDCKEYVKGLFKYLTFSAKDGKIAERKKEEFTEFLNDKN
jgi:hypothetical protein